MVFFWQAASLRFLLLFQVGAEARAAALAFFSFYLCFHSWHSVGCSSVRPGAFLVRTVQAPVSHGQATVSSL